MSQLLFTLFNDSFTDPTVWWHGHLNWKENQQKSASLLKKTKLTIILQSFLNNNARRAFSDWTNYRTTTDAPSVWYHLLDSHCTQLRWTDETHAHWTSSLRPTDQSCSVECLSIWCAPPQCVRINAIKKTISLNHCQQQKSTTALPTLVRVTDEKLHVKLDPFEKIKKDCIYIFNTLSITINITNQPTSG